MGLFYGLIGGIFMSAVIMTKSSLKNTQLSFEKFVSFLEEIFPKELLKLSGVQTKNQIFDQFSHTDTIFQKPQDNFINMLIDVNQNATQSIPQYFSDIVKPILKTLALYYIYKNIKEHQDELDEDYSEQVIEDFITGAIYIHDLHYSFLPYCYQYSLENLVKNGLTFITSIRSAPPKHLLSFIEQVVQFIIFQSNHSSGQVGLPDFFFYQYYFIKKDIEQNIIPKDKEKMEQYVKQQFQIFTYSINQPLRGMQSPFVNLVYMDREYLKTFFKGKKKFPDGSEITDEDIEGIIQLQKLYWNFIREERNRTQFTFPVLAFLGKFSKETGEFIDKDSQMFIQQHNQVWQDTNIYQSESATQISSCCRLRLDTAEMKTKNGQQQTFNFNTGFSTPASDNIDEPQELKGLQNSFTSEIDLGSFKVITLNLPRIAQLSRTKEEFIKILKEKVKMLHQTLYIIKKYILEEKIKQGFLPLYSLGFMNIERQFGTIGIVGVFEAMKLMNLVSEDPIFGVRYTPEGENFIQEILDTINDMNKQQFKKYKINYNIEQVPAEACQQILAQKDRIYFKKYKKPVRNFEEFMIYSNQWIPQSAKTDIQTRIKYQQMFDSKVSGGQILHIFITVQDGEKQNPEEIFQLMCKAQKQGCIYFQFNRKIYICENNHSYLENTDICPVCGQKRVDEMQRIVGYLVPLKNFSEIRKLYDYPYRQIYDVDQIVKQLQNIKSLFQA